jgi:lipoprotein-anchoring transpeptidase ErfK/SrfK
VKEEDLERQLAEAFGAQARASVPDATPSPAPRFAMAPTPSAHGRLVRWAAPLTAAAAVIAIVAAVLAIAHSSSGNDKQAVASPTVGSASASPDAVHVRLLNDDNATYGVGMPVIAFFSKMITDGRPLQQATRATVNGKPVSGSWYFETSDAGKGPIEAHYRLAGYWPAHAKIRVSLPIKGLSAGGKLTYDDSLTTDFSTGAKNIAVVDAKTHLLTLTTDDHKAGSFPVSLGSTATPTLSGTKVIMDKGGDVTMSGPGYSKAHVQYVQRLTYGGEYLHSAPWNEKNIKAGIDSSNGCTNLLPASAKKLYATLRIGDVVKYPNADGPAMQMASGYGDWNVGWTNWLKGGLVRTR